MKIIVDTRSKYIEKVLKNHNKQKPTNGWKAIGGDSKGGLKNEHSSKTRRPKRKEYMKIGRGK